LRMVERIPRDVSADNMLRPEQAHKRANCRQKGSKTEFRQKFVC
jgi:hypothetical protein